ncbi:Hsp70 family protein [Plantactinospora sp. WMMB334]|uniref:Hsp70 family protein n=1 Tax=Plantactinospora sp. WMMB334 TaxID=3404119 RepID=UPI003B946BBA
MRLLAIDFGTSHTVAVARGADGRARPLLFDGTPLLPSAVFLGPDGVPLVGRDAQRAARLDPARFEPHPKRRIDDGTVLLGDRELPVTELVGAVLRRVAAEAGRQLGGVDELRLTHPARWGERRRAVLVAAARAAGLPGPGLVAEPVAAAAYYPALLGAALPPGRALAVYDLGGGTFDAAVVRRTAAGFDVLAESGLTDLGGLDFDQALVDHLGQGYAPGRTGAWQVLLSPAGPGQRRARELLYDDVRAAKELLSRAASADLHLPGLELRAHLTREELEALIRRPLLQTVSCLAATIAAARLDPADLAGIFLVGGSSRIPLAARLIHTELGVAPTTLEQPETVVAEGAVRLDPGGPAGSGAGSGDGGAGFRGDRPGSAPPAVSAPGRSVASPRPAPRPAGRGDAPSPAGRGVPAPTRAAVPADRFWTGTAGLVWTGTLALLVLVAFAVLIAVVNAGPG